MDFVDANELPSTATVDADVCVIGAGPAGLTLASLLDQRSIRVCLVESGSYGPDEQTQALYRIESVGHAVRENFMSRARYFGGTSNLWAGRCMWLSPLDFCRRDWVPHSGWPIPYEEVSRHYPAAARILGLPPPETAEAIFERTRAHPVEGRFIDDDDLQPNLSVWGRRPLRFGAAFRTQLQASRNVAVFLNANVTSIELDRACTRVEACIARTLGGKAIRFIAKRFVVACGGLETARLLLASRSVAPNGIGNDHDTVGRYYMDHPRAVYGRVRLSTPAKLPGLLGLALPEGMAQVGIQLSDTVQRRESLLNNYLTVERQWSDQTARAYQSFVHSAKILLRAGYAGRRFSLSRAQLARVPELIYLLAPREILPHAIYRAARRLKERVTSGVADLVLVNYCEQPPNPRSRVYLGRECDRFGVPRLVLDWVVGGAETRTLLRLHELLDGQLRRAGLGRVDHPSPEAGELRYTDASHHLGTTRMSADPRYGVVDEQCRVHGVTNLFVAGSGVFPTAGHANPTLTIVALAVRLAAYLSRADR
jgi:choline dehydrogenase-like flavoprotein